MEDKQPVHKSCDDMEESPKDNDGSVQEMEESDKTPTTVEIQVVDSVRREPSENQQLPSGASEETPSIPSISVSASPSEALQDSSSSPQNIVPSVDAILSPQQNPSTIMPITEHSEAASTKSEQSGQLLSTKSDNINPALPPQPSPGPMTRSLIKALNSEEKSSPSPDNQSIETDMGSTPAKKRRTESSDSDSGQTGTKKESCRSVLLRSAATGTPDKSPTSVQTRKMRAAALENPASESPTRPLTPNTRKRKLSGSGSSDSSFSDATLKPDLSVPTSAANIDVESTTVQTQSQETVRNPGEIASATDKKIISFQDGTDSDSLAKYSNPDDWHQTKSFMILSREEHETAMHSNASDASSSSPNKVSGEGQRRSLELRVVPSPEKKSGPIEFIRLQTSEVSSSNLVPTSNPQKSTPEDFEPCVEAKLQKPSSVSSEETQLASNMDSDIQMTESSRVRPVIQNPGFPSLPTEVLNPGIEAGGLEATPSNRVLPNPDVSLSCHLPEYSESLVINVPQSASNMAPSATFVQMVESSQSWPVIENPYFPSSREEAGTETQVFETSPSVHIFPNPHVPLSYHLPEYSESLYINVPQSTSNMVPSTSDIQLVESSQSWPVNENPDAPSSRAETGIETQVFETSASGHIFTNPHVPLSSHLSEQSESSNIHLPHKELKSQTCDEKVGNGRNRCDASTQTSKPKVQSKSFREKKLIARSVLDLLSPVKDETSRNSPEDQDPNIILQENLSVPSRDSRSIPSGVVEMELDPPYLDTSEGQSSTSSHQPVVTGGSSTENKFNSSQDNAASGETRRGTTIPNTSANEITKYATNAQELLLKVFKEVMEFNTDKEELEIFTKLFHIVSAFPTFGNGVVLYQQLMRYLAQRENTFVIPNLFNFRQPTMEDHMKAAYECLTRIVVVILGFTSSKQSRKYFTEMISCYTAFKALYEKCSENFKHVNVGDAQKRDPVNRVMFLKDMMQRHLLQTENAFRELLMHIGENAEQDFIDLYVDKVCEFDRGYLRRQI